MTKDERQLIRIMKEHVRKAKKNGTLIEVKGKNDIGITPQKIQHYDCLWGIPQDSNIISATEPMANSILDNDVKIKYNVKDKPTEEIFINSVDIPSSYLKVKSIKFDSKQAEALVIVKNDDYAIYKKLKALMNDKEVFPIVYKRTYPDSDNVLRISFYGGVTLVAFDSEDGLCLKIKGGLIKEEDETGC